MHMGVRICICLHVRACMHMYICLHVHMCACMCVYGHTHVHMLTLYVMLNILGTAICKFFQIRNTRRKNRSH